MHLCAVVSFLSAVVASFLFPAILKITNNLELTANGELVKAENRLLRIIDSCQESIALLSRDLYMIRGNASTKRIFGSQIDHCKITDVMHPDDIESFVTAASVFFESIAADGLADMNSNNIYMCNTDPEAFGPVNVEFRIRDSKRNGWRWMKSTLVCSESSNFGSSHSIQMHNYDSHDVMIITSDVHAKKTEYDMRLQTQERENLAKLQYITCCAHDLKTPLQSFSFVLELLKDSGLTDDQLQLYSQAHISVSLMNLTISQTMDINKVMMGYSIKPRKSTVNLCGVMHKVAVIIEGYSRRVPITFSIANTVFNDIITDEEWVWQMILNLLTNACKYTEEGSIQVVCRRCDQNDKMLLFELIDTGVGVTEKTLNTLFNPYTQAQQGQNTGTGLGLYGVRIRAEGLGGSCGVRPNKLKGSIFWFKIPYVVDPTLVKLDNSTEGSVSWNSADKCSFKTAGGLRITVDAPGSDKGDIDKKSGSQLSRLQSSDFIVSPTTDILRAVHERSTMTSSVSTSPLPNQRKYSSSSIEAHENVVQSIRERELVAFVVDDVQSIRKLLRRTLLNLGFKEVYTFENGSKALDVMKEEVVDVVFMDIQMPVMSGPEAIHRLREYEASKYSSGRRRQFVCAVSANLESEVECVGWDGFDKTLTKPLDTANIIQTMQEYLSGFYPLIRESVKYIPQHIVRRVNVIPDT
eukprot:CAMPEP_0185041062 /NCGR_PEP_ID=MMETSP1103-20130426/39863_1 /TAXON_ID=36769 /ORGANISM="Paraphysomonas bandaiensis, Strain Caron Lab Isolate" /LENGTH=692 /DNA_ID=CAMNT_0027580635 /DNA_START=82 /DNA_END=2160 /DNA_ORIENTATION=+